MKPFLSVAASIIAATTAGLTFVSEAQAITFSLSGTFGEAVDFGYEPPLFDTYQSDFYEDDFYVEDEDYFYENEYGYESYSQANAAALSLEYGSFSGTYEASSIPDSGFVSFTNVSIGLFDEQGELLDTLSSGLKRDANDDGVDLLSFSGGTNLYASSFQLVVPDGFNGTAEVLVPGSPPDEFGSFYPSDLSFFPTFAFEQGDDLFAYASVEVVEGRSEQLEGDDIGESEGNPVLPDVLIDEDNAEAPPLFVFEDVLSGQWFDPPATSAFEYTMTGGSLFTDILDFPTGFADPFSVSVGGTDLGSFIPGDTLNFVDELGAGVSSFILGSINPGVDSTDPMAFPLQLAFDTPAASFTMQAVNTDATAVPTPALIPGLLGMGIATFRKKRKMQQQAA